ncbi:hypothetical protein ES703_56504 [subsurface metagenome]
MDGWNTIKEVRVELSEATMLAKTGRQCTAYACMAHARDLLVTYCNKEKGGKHGFEGRGPKH